MRWALKFMLLEKNWKQCIGDQRGRLTHFQAFYDHFCKFAQPRNGHKQRKTPQKKAALFQQSENANLLLKIPAKNGDLPRNTIQDAVVPHWRGDFGTRRPHRPWFPHLHLQNLLPRNLRFLVLLSICKT
ncbi:hypothetical protein PAPYR_10000 [Paratrimastix pyriformis]|uniref:Uncharacterized protein n=1 Tax=Paratrimastix pyriformis TaxID=342808 RepID=A0ABQ8U5Q4_9EUKA|nr:hypothetical protein PAPYR_12449 [Paratrimastix pyriformis]KAJ4455098.1 hypothetical protein PAPYR_10000 [Paratrimastix pyriformis]